MKLLLWKNCLVEKIIYILTLCIAVTRINQPMDIVMVIVSCVLPFVFPLLFRLKHKKMSDEMLFLNITFMYFASLIGSCLGGYRWMYFDKVIHFVSGMIVFTLGLLIYEGWVKDKMTNIFKHVFCHLFGLSVATCWEFFEYFMLVVFNNDCIRHYTTGVHDCMSDMICAFMGALLVSLIIEKTKKPSYFENLVHHFYEGN